MIVFPIVDDPDQKFSTVVDGRRVSLRLRYNARTDRWSFDLAIDDAYVLHGRRIVTGVDLLAAFNFGIGMVFALGTKGAEFVDRTSLVDGRVEFYHASRAEYDAAISSESSA